MSGRRNAIRAVLPLLGGVLLVLGEHLWRTTPARPYLSLLGGALLLAALAWNAGAARRIERLGDPQSRNGWTLLWPTVAWAAAAAIYGLSLLLEAPAEEAEGFDWPAVAGWAWVFAALFGSVLYVFVELAWLAQAGAPAPDGRRLRFARQAGVSLGVLLLIGVTLNFVFNHLPWSWDLGYFRTAEAGDATRETVRNLDAPVEVALFFPQGNPVGALVRDYFLPLEGLSPHLALGYYDAELNPQAAQDFRARRNGLVAVRREGVNRTLTLNLEVDEARDKLAEFDSNFLKELARVTREKRTVYFTVGHAERNEKANELPATARIKGFEALLRAQNFRIKPLGLSEGLGTDVPPEAFMVVVAGPRRPFRATEEDALARYLAGGGRMLAFFEPEGDPPPPGVAADRGGPALAGLLASYGATYRPVVHTNDRIFGRRTQTKADFALLATARYQNHPAVASLRRNANQFPLLLLESGAWELGDAPEGLQARQIVLGMPGTWDDLNRNFAFDEPDEKRGTPPLAVAVGPGGRGRDPEAEADGPPQPRIVAYGDADVASDLFIQNRANQLALLDAVAWLADDPAPAATPDESEDLRIQHLKGDEVVWFYLPVFAVPLLVLAIGFVVTRRGRRSQGGGDA